MKLVRVAPYKQGAGVIRCASTVTRLPVLSGTSGQIGLPNQPTILNKLHGRASDDLAVDRRCVFDCHVSSARYGASILI